jgi:ABC-type microcin C transport system duplicated ATPase subunit YejF
MSTTEPVLSISGLAVAFRTGSELVTAISDISIDVAAGTPFVEIRDLRKESRSSGSPGRASRPPPPLSTVCCLRTV